jgi:hypothetical protein
MNNTKAAFRNTETVTSISKEEIDIALNKIFDSASNAINETRQKELNITLEQVDITLKAIFDAINMAAIEGKNIKVPNFSKILN